MASSVVSDNFETSTGAIPNMGGADVTTRLCSAWVNFNGVGTVAIRASFNVSSITDNSAGNYTINFTTALSDANYAFVGTGICYSATNITGSSQLSLVPSGVGTNLPLLKSTSQVSFLTGNPSNGVPADSGDISITIQGS